MKSDVATSLLSRLKAAKRLPSPPGTALKILELCRRDDVELQEVADALMADAALSGRLLKFANSPISGVGREVTNIRDAILLLGLRTVKLNALGFSLSSPEHRPRCPGFDLNRFWAESFATGVVARRLAQPFFHVDREEAFTAGLLAKIGRLALAHGMPEDYARALQSAATDEGLIEAERAVLGVDHVEFAVQLLTDWNVPQILIDSLGGLTAYPPSPDPLFALARAVHVSTRLAPLFVQGHQLRPGQGETARRLVTDTLKLDEPQWREISEGILSEYLQVADVFDFKIQDPSEVIDLYAEAQEEATRVGMVAQLEGVEAAKANVNLLQQATTDALTSLPNRAKFDERFNELLKGLRRGHADFALLLLDIDHFKKVNDTYGHPVGDLVLRRVGRVVANALRDVDLLARYGGEEFGILLPQSERRAACIVAARIRKCVEEMRVEHQGQALNVTISVGVAITSDYPVAPAAEKLIADADSQLYLSKKSGRNTWSYHNHAASQVARPAVSV